jgi:hypothetical protein
MDLGLSLGLTRGRGRRGVRVLAVLVDENGDVLIDEDGNAYTMFITLVEEPAP